MSSFLGPSGDRLGIVTLTDLRHRPANESAFGGASKFRTPEKRPYTDKESGELETTP